MPTNAAYIIGTIEQHEGKNVIFVLAPPGEHGRVAPDSHVTVWNQVGANGPLAMFQGRITEISGNTGAFTVTQKTVPQAWPEKVDPLGEGNPVYLAVPGTYLPDPGRTATHQEMKLMAQLARDHEENTSLKTQGAGLAAFALPDPLPDEQEGRTPAEREGADQPRERKATTVVVALPTGDLDLDLMESVADLNIMNEEAEREEGER